MFKKSDQRKTYLIDRQFQGTVILLSIGMSIVAVAVNYFLMWAIIDGKIILPQTVGTDQFSPDGIKWMMHGFFIIQTATMLVMMIMLGLTITNQAAGPIFRLNKLIEQFVSGGRLEKFVERKGDTYFRGLIENYNKMVDKLNSPGDK